MKHVLGLLVMCAITGGELTYAGDLNFRVHEIGQPGGTNFGQTSAVDIDKDGDIDILIKPWTGDLHLFVENQLRMAEKAAP